jgi:hypothetical protein
MVQKAIDKKKDKSYYTVKVECTVPCSLTYRIYADDAEDALIQLKRAVPIAAKPNLGVKQNVKATVYEYGQLMIKLVRNYARI